MFLRWPRGSHCSRKQHAHDLMLTGSVVRRRFAGPRRLGVGTSCKTDTEGFWGIVRETRMVIYSRRNAVTVAESWCLNSSEGAETRPIFGKAAARAGRAGLGGRCATTGGPLRRPRYFAPVACDISKPSFCRLSAAR